LKLLEHYRLVSGSQNVNHTENTQAHNDSNTSASGNGGVPKVSNEEKVISEGSTTVEKRNTKVNEENTIMEADIQDRQHVINRKSKKDLFNQMKNFNRK
jgi:hypothetical protein